MRYTGHLISLVAAALVANGSVAMEPEPGRVSREDAIELARNGDFDQALSILGALRDASPADGALLHDETVVLAWAGEDRLALDNAVLIESATAPDYVLRTVARSARNIGEFEQAARWYLTLLERDAANLDARRGLAMTYADEGSFDLAWASLEQAPVEQQDDADLILTEAYLHEGEARFLEALACYQHVAEAQPTNEAAIRGAALMLRQVLLPRQALALALEHPGVLSDEEILHLEADVAAIQIRYGAQSYYPDSRRHQGTDLALSKVEELLARSDLDPEMRSRLRYDRIVGLSNRLRNTEAIAEFESLDVDAANIPAYALASVGRAYLSEQRPELARDYLELAVAKEPKNFHFKFQLFFVYTDLRDQERALNLAEELMETLPEINRVPGSRVVKGNRAHLRAAIMLGLAQAYFDQLAYSQDYFEGLLARVPHNTDIRHELANVYRWRGWLDRSLSEYSQVLAVEPDLMSARVGNAHVRLDSRDYETVEKELSALSEYHNDEPAVKNLAKRWKVQNLSELVTSVEFGESSGPTFGNDQYNVDAVWFSRPIAHNYRATLFTHDAYADFPEGDSRRRRMGAGIEYRRMQWLASARLSAPRDGGTAGFRGAFDYRLNDLWSLGAVIETASNSTPLRAERVGIDSDLLGLSVAFARNESADVRASVGYQDYSDGNTSTSWLLRARQRLISRPDFRVTVTGEVFADDRKRDEVVYFSPKSSASWSAGLRYDWIMARRYDFGLTHSLTGQMGEYDQSGFDADSVWSLNYDLDADINSRLSANVGLSRSSNVYDGTREYATFFRGGFQWKF